MTERFFKLDKRVLSARDKGSPVSVQRRWAAVLMSYKAGATDVAYDPLHGPRRKGSNRKELVRRLGIDDQRTFGTCLKTHLRDWPVPNYLTPTDIPGRYNIHQPGPGEFIIVPNLLVESGLRPWAALSILCVRANLLPNTERWAYRLANPGEDLYRLSIRDDDGPYSLAHFAKARSGSRKGGVAATLVELLHTAGVIETVFSAEGKYNADGRNVGGRATIVRLKISEDTLNRLGNDPAAGWLYTDFARAESASGTTGWAYKGEAAKVLDFAEQSANAPTEQTPSERKPTQGPQQSECKPTQVPSANAPTLLGRVDNS